MCVVGRERNYGDLDSFSSLSLPPAPLLAKELLSLPLSVLSFPVLFCSFFLRCGVEVWIAYLILWVNTEYIPIYVYIYT